MHGADLETAIKRHEGCKLRAYQDTRGVWTIGYGRNLQTMTIPQELADQWIEEDITAATWAAKKFPEWEFLDTDARQNAFIEMCFNLGAAKLAGFHLMLAAIRQKDWTEVAKQALNSDWAPQVGKRAIEIINMFQTGNFLP